MPPQYTYETPPPMLVTITNPGDVSFPPAAQTKLDEIETAVDGLEAAITALNGHVDGLEGFTDGLEGLLTSTLAAVDGLEGFTDGLEGFTDGLEASLTTIAGHVDTLEAKLTPSTTTVQAFNSDVDVASEALTGTSLVCTGPCIVTSHPSNTAVLMVSFDGTDASATNGVPIGPGQAAIGNVANLNLIKVYALAVNQSCSAHAPG